MRTPFLALTLSLSLVVSCSGTRVDSDDGEAGGTAGTDAGGTGGANTGGTGGANTGGTGGANTGGIGGSNTGGFAASGTCAVGGAPAYCEDDIFHPSDPMCSGQDSPAPVPCTDDTPLCGFYGCTACPGAGGAPMVSIGMACIDVTETTRAHYEAWLATSPSTASQDAACASNVSFAPDPDCMAQAEVCASGCENHPQTCVDWCDASAFCAAVGKRLCGTYPQQNSGYWKPEDPTELGEACHDGTLESFPYGPDHQAGTCNGNELAGTTVPVGSLADCAREQPGGKVYDLVGNVWEWQQLCDATTCTARGGSFAEDGEKNTCSATASYPRDLTASNLGFRCCAP